MKHMLLAFSLGLTVSAAVCAGAPGAAPSAPSAPSAPPAAPTAASGDDMAATSMKLKVGDHIPDVSLSDQNGHQVRLRDTGGNPTVLVFYRGYWCPYCARHLADLRSLVQPGENVRLLGVSIDPPETTKAFAEKIGNDGKGPVSFPILSDPGHKVIDMFGIRNVEHDGERFEGIPYPAVYVVDGNGVITWAVVEFDYKKRPTNDEIRAALHALR